MYFGKLEVPLILIEINKLDKNETYLEIDAGKIYPFLEKKNVGAAKFSNRHVHWGLFGWVKVEC